MKVIARYCALLMILYTGLSYRLYLARYHTEVGIQGMAGWWGYIIGNVDTLRAGAGLSSGTLYAPGQSLAAYLIFSIFPSTPATLRVCFGFLDAVAILFVFLAGKEMLNWASGLIAALFYSLWPEGASASVNILHDHSPQPLFLFAGLWCVLLWLRTPKWFLLVTGGALLGMPAMFRTDAVVVTLAVPLAILVIMAVRRGVSISTIWPAVVLFVATLIPSLPYDFYLLKRNHRFTHIAAGDGWSPIFIRYGRVSGMGGSRYADSEVAFVSGVNQPFGYSWFDARRLSVPAKFGKSLFLADPLKYFKIVLLDSWPFLSVPAGYQFWLPPGWARMSDVRLAVELDNPEWPVAVLASYTGVQTFLSNRVAILIVAFFGLILGLIRSWRPALLVAMATVSWAGTLLMLVPNSRYLVMPLCLVFPLMGVCFGSVLYLAKDGFIALQKLQLHRKLWPPRELA